MTEQERIKLIIQDPNTYYDYYDEKYRTTLNIIKRLENKDIPSEHLLHLRVQLAQLAGKRTIAIAAINGKDTLLLIKLWNSLVDDAVNAEDSFTNVEVYEKNSLYIQKKCLE